jgi:formylglycine-generating enzyme required for sulfatase activity
MCVSRPVQDQLQLLCSGRDRLRSVRLGRACACVVFASSSMFFAARATAAAGTLAAGDIFADCEGCPEMVVIPAGEFAMGADRSELGSAADERPPHRVRIAKSFAVGRFAVTFAQWDACVADGGCNGYGPPDEGWGRDLRPVINVSWYDAKSYISWLSQKAGVTYRLLSEAEREYVSRAGTLTPFWWGATISVEDANYSGAGHGGAASEQSQRKTLPVDQLRPNPWGLYHVHGNVYDWTEDCFNESYVGAPSDGSAWLSGDCDRRVHRGGSWYSDPAWLRSASRNRNLSITRFNFVGFRVARTLAVER